MPQTSQKYLRHVDHCIWAEKSFCCVGPYNTVFAALVTYIYIYIYNMDLKKSLIIENLYNSNREV